MANLDTSDGKTKFSSEDVKEELQAMLERMQKWEADSWVRSIRVMLRRQRRQVEDMLYECRDWRREDGD